MVYWETVDWSPHHPLWLVACFNYHCYHPLLLASGRTPHETLGASQLSPVVAASIPKFAGFWIASYGYSKSPCLFHWNAEFKPFFLLKLKYPIISCWNAHSRPWNLRLTSELRGFVVGIPGPGASCARRRVAFKRPCSRPGGRPSSFEAQLGEFKHVN